MVELDQQLRSPNLPPILPTKKEQYYVEKSFIQLGTFDRENIRNTIMQVVEELHGSHTDCHVTLLVNKGTPERILIERTKKM